MNILDNSGIILQCLHKQRLDSVIVMIYSNITCPEQAKLTFMAKIKRISNIWQSTANSSLSQKRHNTIVTFGIYKLNVQTCSGIPHIAVVVFHSQFFFLLSRFDIRAN